MRVFSLVSTLFAALTAIAPAAAQQATRPITLIVPFTPGNSIDSVGRMLSTSYEKQLGQKIVVEYRPGTGTYAGSAYVARSVPDGQTLLINIFDGLDVNVFVKDLEIDLPRSLTPLAVPAVAQQFLLSSATVPARNLAEFVAYARKNPNKLNVASLGNTANWLSTLLFMRTAGIELVHVPYNTLPVSALIN